MFISYERARNTEKLKVWKSFKFSVWSIVIWCLSWKCFHGFRWNLFNSAGFLQLFFFLSLSEFSSMILVYIWPIGLGFIASSLCESVSECRDWYFYVWNELNQVISKIQSKMMTRIQPLVWKLDQLKKLQWNDSVDFHNLYAKFLCFCQIKDIQILNSFFLTASVHTIQRSTVKLINPHLASGSFLICHEHIKTIKLSKIAPENINYFQKTYIGIHWRKSQCEW